MIKCTKVWGTLHNFVVRLFLAICNLTRPTDSSKRCKTHKKMLSKFVYDNDRRHHATPLFGIVLRDEGKKERFAVLWRLSDLKWCRELDVGICYKEKSNLNNRPFLNCIPLRGYSLSMCGIKGYALFWGQFDQHKCLCKLKQFLGRAWCEEG